MTSSFAKSSVFEEFFLHTETQSRCFKIPPVWKAFSKSIVFSGKLLRISFDGKLNRRNFSGMALMEPEWRSCLECTKRSSIHAIKKIQLSVYSQPNLNVNCIYCRIRLTILFVVFPLACNCNPEGSLNVSCNEYGECNCKFGVLGIKCDSCEENKHNLTAGCVSKYCCNTDTIFFGRLFCPFTVLLFIWRTSKALGEGRLLEL